MTPTPADPTLDVERLLLALEATDCDPFGGEHHERPFAAALAREYARLATEAALTLTPAPLDGHQTPGEYHDYLTTSEQHRLACGTCGQRLRDHNEQSGHAFVRTFAPDPAPLDVERLAVVAAARALRERLTIDPGNVVSWGEWDTLDEALAAIEGDKP